MKTAVRSFIPMFLLSLGNILFAQQVTVNKAIAVAKNHLSVVAGDTFKSADAKKLRPQLIPVLSSVTKTDTLLFILNDTVNNNFVIVAADERVWPIIAYSLKSEFNENNQPPAFTEWIENKKREIQYIKHNNIQPENAVNEQWSKLSTSNFSTTQTSASVEPLLKTTWSQGCYFNAQCPSDGAGPCGHALTGCVATSMAQIMKYWGYPTKGTGSNSYMHSAYGNLSADFSSTTYNWAQMPDNVTSQNDAIATLLFHCGVSVEMDYGAATSGAGIPVNALVYNFNYSPSANFVNKSSYSESEWSNLLKTELDLKRPVWYMGNNSEEGHAWVCDGYQNSDYFHFNWGWGGNQDGYFYLGSINYSTDQAAIVKILPVSLPDGFQGFFLSENRLTIGGNGGTATTSISSSENWTATSDQLWLSVNTGTGIPGTSQISLTADDNNTDNTRSAIVTISANGYDDQLITVSQGTNYVITPGLLHPGTLRDVLGNKLASITKLTINDTIDARDFKTMRDEMPVLAELDLNHAIISEYTGMGGTSGIVPILKTYPANTIPEIAFYYNSTCLGKTSMTKVILPESLTTIGGMAFASCRGLTSISIPNSVITISDLAFFDCSGMTSIYIPSSVTTIGSQVFSANSGMITVAPDNPYYSGNGGVLFDKNQYKLFHCPLSKSGDYSIPPTVISIENGAFEGCNNLTSITIPPSVISIGRIAFYYCLGLSSITIPSSVTTIGEQAFWYNKALIYVDADNMVFSSFGGALFNKPQTKLIQCSWALTSFNIPSTVTEIGAHSFENCTKLTSVTIPSSVNTIGDYAFWSTCNLSNVYIPSSVNSIGEFAFHAFGTYSQGIVNVSTDNQYYSSSDGVLYDKSQKKLILCPDFKKGTFIIPSTVETIVNGAFLYCSFLTSIIIPSSVTAIGHEAFADCSGLQSLITRSKSPLSLSNDSYTGSYKVFNRINKATCTLYVPYLTKDLYSNAAQWKDFINIKEASEGFLPRKMSALVNTEEGSNTTIELKANVRWTASSDQSWLTVSPVSGTGDATLKFTATSNTTSSIRKAKVTISAIGFESDTITISQSNKVTITAGGLHDAFATMLSTMTSLQISGTIDARDFKTMRDEMPMLSQVDISDATIVDYLGSGGTNFNGTTISYPANTTPDFAFTNAAWKGKNSLTSILLPKSLKSIGTYAFRWCIGLTEITIPPSVISIGGSAFHLCYGLSKLTIPSSMTSISSFAFYDCTNLNSIYAYPGTPIVLNSSSDVFANVNKITCKLYVPKGSAILYSAANQWKDFTNMVEIPGFLLSSNTLTISAEENSSASVEVASYTSWNVSSDKTWLKANPSTFTGNGTISFVAAANTTEDKRTANVTISADGFDSQTISITQEKFSFDMITVAESSNNFKCFPNPFEREININIQNPSRSEVSVAVYDLAGQKIKSLVNECKDEHIDLSWNGTNDLDQPVTPGIYICKVNNTTKRLIFTCNSNLR